VTREAYDARVTPDEATAGSPILSIDGQVARIVLARPEQHNALTVRDVDRMRAHLVAVENDPDVRVLVVTGRGATFCAGASLQEIETGDMTGALFETLTDDLEAVRVPTVCALNGSVFGGGAEIAFCCDFRIGVPGTRVSVPAARLGLCYPPRGLRRYVQGLGLTVASRLLLAGEELDADEMLAVGFVQRLVAAEQLDTATAELASRLATLAPLAVQGMKRILRQLARGEADPREANRVVEACESSWDLKEGLAARRERRPPKFRGA
jgi:enoyl-CoA hydratase/carnithine racemase